MKSDSEQSKTELLEALKTEKHSDRQFLCIIGGIGILVLITGTILIYLILV
jgi:hypothetical protein